MLNLKHFLVCFFALDALLVSLCSCSGQNDVDMLDDMSVYQNGDIVFRLGDSSVSNLVMVADEKSDFSHVGIVWIDNGCPMIIHACPPDIDDVDPDNCVKMDSVSVFFSNKNAINGALYRFTDKNVAYDAATTAKGFYDDAVPFDYNFDSNDTTALYCTELVERAFMKYGVSLSDNQRRSVDIPGVNIDSCILISDFVNNDRLSLIASFGE